MRRSPHSLIEPLEARLAPAVLVIAPVSDQFLGLGRSEVNINLATVFDDTAIRGTEVSLQTNFDSDGNGAPDEVVFELYDRETPITVANFLKYATRPANGYDETFFHRAIPGFVVQGGGFLTDRPVTHIAVDAPIQNEFSPERSNLRGTIAMAKVGNDPNSATSEWFVNVADNSANLDNQNGGFTVFGRVKEGLELFDTVTALPQVSPGGALTDVPVQNYNSDPDNNAATPEPLPTPAQLIAITGVQVLPEFAATPGGPSQVQLQIVGITDAATGLPSTAATVTLSGSQLKVNVPAAGAFSSGALDVSVRATNAAGESVIETFRVNVIPVLATIDADTLPQTFVAGEKGTVRLQLGNATGAATAGVIDVTFFLENIATGERNAIGTLQNQSVNIPSGKSLFLTSNVAIPRELTEGVLTSHRITADVSADSGAAALATIPDAFDGRVHAWVNAFGTFTGDDGTTRRGVPLLYQDAEGHAVRMTLTGSGGAVVELTPDGRVLVQTQGSSTSTGITVASIGGRTDLNSFQINGPVGIVNLAAVDLHGSFSAVDGLRSLSLGDVDNGVISIGAAARATAKASVSLGRVVDVDLASNQPLSTLKAVEWLDTGDNDESIVLTSLDRGRIAGNLEASLNVRGEAKVTSLTVAGTLRDGEVQINGAAGALRFGSIDGARVLVGSTVVSNTPVTSFVVDGLARDATIRISGNVGSASFGAMVRSSFFVGINSVPDDVTDFVSVRTVGSFTIRGLPGTTDALSDSGIIAANFGTISVTGVQPVSATSQPFGFIADAIRSYNRVGGPRATNLTTGTFDPAGNYSVRLV